MEADGGDSGGPVFMIKDVIDGKVTCKLLGIMCCIDNEYSYFSKYLNIVNELGVSAITQQNTFYIFHTKNTCIP